MRLGCAAGFVASPNFAVGLCWVSCDLWVSGRLVSRVMFQPFVKGLFHHKRGLLSLVDFEVDSIRPVGRGFKIDRQKRAQKRLVFERRSNLTGLPLWLTESKRVVFERRSNLNCSFCVLVLSWRLI